MKSLFAAIMLTLGLTLLTASSLHAQVTTPSPPATPEPPRQPCPIPPLPPLPPLPPVGLSKVIYPVNLIMKHARALGLTAEQRAFMQEEIQATTKKYNELQWGLNDAMEVLVEAVKSEATTEQDALDLLDKVLGFEREIKRVHIIMGIRIKNKLSSEQRKKLEELRSPPAQSSRQD